MNLSCMFAKRKALFLFAVLQMLPFASLIHATVPGDLIAEHSQNNEFPIVSSQNTAAIWYDNRDFAGVKRAVLDLQSDIEKVTSKKIKTSTLPGFSEYSIIVGTVGNNDLIDQLIKTKKLSKSDLEGKWESYVLTTLENPFPGVKKALVI